MPLPLAEPLPDIKDTLLPAGREWVERRMAELGLTTAELALRLGMAPKHVADLLHGRVPLSAEATERLARALGLDAVLLSYLRHDGIIPPSIDDVRPMPIKILADSTEPMEGWFEDNE